jgi:hypothetical protein
MDTFSMQRYSNEKISEARRQADAYRKVEQAKASEKVGLRPIWRPIGLAVGRLVALVIR